MADLIDRKAAIDKFEPWLKVKGYNEGELNMLKAVLYELKCLPSAELVIVRCKDCKHLFDGEHNANCCEVLMRKAKWLTEITVDMNWSCADGERRRGE